MLDPQKLQPNKQQLLPRWYCDVPFLVAQGFHDVFLKAALLWRSRSIYQMLNSWIMIFFEILLPSRVSLEICQKQQKLSKIQWLHEITIYLIYPRSCLRRPMLPWPRRSFQRTSATILESRATSTFIVRLSKPCSLVLEVVQCWDGRKDIKRYLSFFSIFVYPCAFHLFQYFCTFAFVFLQGNPLGIVRAQIT